MKKKIAILAASIACAAVCALSAAGCSYLNGRDEYTGTYKIVSYRPSSFTDTNGTTNYYSLTTTSITIAWTNSFTSTVEPITFTAFCGNQTYKYYSEDTSIDIDPSGYGESDLTNRYASYLRITGGIGHYARCISENVLVWKNGGDFATDLVMVRQTEESLIDDEQLTGELSVGYRYEASSAIGNFETLKFEDGGVMLDSTYGKLNGYEFLLTDRFDSTINGIICEANDRYVTVVLSLTYSGSSVISTNDVYRFDRNAA